MSSSANIVPTVVKVAKGRVEVVGYYEAVAVPLNIDKRHYTTFSKEIKDAGRQQIEDLMGEFGSKEKVADFLTEQLNMLKSSITTYSKYSSQEILQKLWGKDYMEKTISWFNNISSLLYLKRIKNDEYNGWQIIEEKIITNVKDAGNEFIGRAKNVEELLKMMKKMKATMTA